MVEIRIDGPGKNALGTARMRELLGAIEGAGSEPLLLTGAGDAFSAGLDLKEVYDADLAQMEVFLTLLTELLDRLLHHPAPTVAAINGHAIAGGYLVAMVCDHKVMTDSPRARVGLNEVALGLRFPPRILAMIQARVPRNHQHELLLGASLHGPTDALRLGLVDALDPDPVLVGRRVLEQWSAHPRDAYADAKRGLNARIDAIGDAEHQRFVHEVLPVWAGPDIKRRIAGFLGR